MFQKFFGIEGFLWIGDGKRITFLRLNFFCLTVPKTFAGSTLVFQKCSGVEFFRDNGVDKILSKFLGLTVPKIFGGGTIQCFRIIRAWTYFMHKRRYHYFLLQLFFSQFHKSWWGNHSSFQKYSGMEKLIQKKGISLFSVGTFFSHSALKFS